MSILIKGIDMPKCSNEDIMVVIRRDKAEVWQTGYKERTVEAIQIPTPHGRLIDADELIEAHYNYCNKHHGEADVFYMWSKDLMDKTPTIIEEER